MAKANSNKICTISVEYELDTSGQLGGHWEEDPYISTYATWGAHRINREDFLQEVKSTNSNTTTSRTKKSAPINMPLSHFALGDKKKEAEELVEVKEVIQQREVKRYRSTRALQYALPDYDEHRSDDAIKFKLFCHTRFAGVPFLDKAESAYVRRQIQEGLTHLELLDMFAQYRALAAQKRVGPEGMTWRISDSFVDDKIVLEKVKQLAGTQDLTDTLYNKYAPRARDLTAKSQIVFEVTITQFREDLYAKSVFATKDLKKTGLYAHLSSQRKPLSLSTRRQENGKTSANAQFDALMYNSERSQLLMAQTMLQVLQLYCDSFIKLNEKHRPLYRPSEPVIQNLQLPMYVGENGRLPVLRYFANHDPFYRQYATPAAREKDLALYAYDERTEAYFLMMLRSSLRRHGLSEATFVRTINEHFSVENKSRELGEHLKLCEEVVLDVGTFVANSAYYTADYRFMTLRDHPHPPAGPCPKCGKKMTAKVIHLDSWDNTILNGTSMCDDCEGQDNVASTVLRSFKVGRHALKHAWKSEALLSVQLYLKHSYIWDVGSLVTSAFMNTDNTKMELQQKDDLPMIGSEMDQRAQNDGHCFFVGKTRLQVTAQMSLDPRISSETKARMKADAYLSDAFVAREQLRQDLVGEGTGSIEPRILSLEESYGCHTAIFRKKRAERAFTKHARGELKKEENEGFAQLFNGEGLTHYVDKQDPGRRTSSFYNSVVHGVCPELAHEYGAELGQVAFCTEINRETCYGVRIGALVRGSKESRLSMVCPYAGQRELWQRAVAPMIETVENQMPVMRFGRYSEEEYARIYSRFVAPSEVDEQYKFDAADNEENGKKREAFESKLFALESQPDRTVVRFYSRAWKLNKDPKSRSAMMKFLRAMPGLVEYGFFVERHMPILGDDAAPVEILCIIDVKRALELE